MAPPTRTSSADTDTRSAERSEWDSELVDIANYVCSKEINSKLAYETAHYSLFDALACAFQALDYKECTKLVGPIVPGATLEHGAHVPGTSHTLDPVTAAFSIGILIRWLDFNDTWLAQEWGHPSDNLGAILSIADYISRKNRASGKDPLTMKDVLTAMIKAYEIQGVLALENSWNRLGFDHVVLVRVASTAVVTQLLGGTRSQVLEALSQAWLDGAALRTYRHAPNAGSRKSWAAGDATSRAVRLALLTMTGEMGYPSALSAKTWGVYDVMHHGKPFQRQRDYGSYVMENILWKISYPAEFHGQTCVEACVTLHPQIVEKRVENIEKIQIETQEAAMRIIDKTGPLDNPADRDHCLQYMAAVPLLFGRLTAADYQEDVASDARVDVLRDKMKVCEYENFSRDYLDPNKRSIGNAVQIFFKDGSSTERVEVNYPIGHPRRRSEGLVLLKKKFVDSVSPKLSSRKWNELKELFENHDKLLRMAVDDFVELLVP